MARRAAHPVAREFEGAELGDARRTQRLLMIADAVVRQPDKSFPQLAAGEAELEALYRFLGNPEVNFDDVLQPHQRRTAERAEEAGEVLVVHDTTDCEFVNADPKAVGFLQTGRPGFYAHVSLVVSANGERTPLGVAAVQTIFRKSRRRPGRKAHASGSETTKRADRESKRWEDGIAQSELLLASCQKRIHLADREGDSYSLLARLILDGCRFVVRVRHDRVAREQEPDAPWSKLKELVGGAEHCLEREVPLSARRKVSTAPRQARTRPLRKARLAKLRFASTQVEVRRPKHFRDPYPELLALNVVRVYEVDAPDGEEPVEWLLVTSEPVTTPKQIARVVDFYRARWLIEEFFKALKTGCLYEQRQLESRRALLNALAIFIPVACQMLWVRSRAQHAPEAPACEVLSSRQLRILLAICHKPLPDEPSARDALLAIAALGGHLSNNGEPGWATIGRGFQRLLDCERGWIAART